MDVGSFEAKISQKLVKKSPFFAVVAAIPRLALQYNHKSPEAAKTAAK
jgi:hypothetical protein